jgi:hypothetical protein
MVLETKECLSSNNGESPTLVRKTVSYQVIQHECVVANSENKAPAIVSNPLAQFSYKNQNQQLNRIGKTDEDCEIVQVSDSKASDKENSFADIDRLVEKTIGKQQSSLNNRTKKSDKNADIAKTMRPISQFFTKFEYTKVNSANKFTS